MAFGAGFWDLGVCAGLLSVSFDTVGLLVSSKRIKGRNGNTVVIPEWDADTNLVSNE